MSQKRSSKISNTSLSSQLSKRLKSNKSSNHQSGDQESTRDHEPSLRLRFSIRNKIINYLNQSSSLLLDSAASLENRLNQANLNEELIKSLMELPIYLTTVSTRESSLSSKKPDNNLFIDKSLFANEVSKAIDEYRIPKNKKLATQKITSSNESFRPIKSDDLIEKVNQRSNESQRNLSIPDQSNNKQKIDRNQNSENSNKFHTQPHFDSNVKISSSVQSQVKSKVQSDKPTKEEIFKYLNLCPVVPLVQNTVKDDARKSSDERSNDNSLNNKENDNVRLKLVNQEESVVIQSSYCDIVNEEIEVSSNDLKIDNTVHMNGSATITFKLEDIEAFFRNRTYRRSSKIYIKHPLRDQVFAFNMFIRPNDFKTKNEPKDIDFIIECNGEGQYWYCKAEIEFKMINQLPNVGGKDKVWKSKHRFCVNQADFGLTSFTSYKEFTNFSKGFYVNEMIILEAKIKIT